MESSLRHAGYFIVAHGLFVAVHRLLSSCGMQVFSSLVVARELCSLWHAGSLVEARKLSSCGAWDSLPHGMWDLSSPTRDQTRVPCSGRQILYYWTTRKVPGIPIHFC